MANMGPIYLNAPVQRPNPLNTIGPGMQSVSNAFQNAELNKILTQAANTPGANARSVTQMLLSAPGMSPQVKAQGMQMVQSAFPKQTFTGVSGAPGWVMGEDGAIQQSADIPTSTDKGSNYAMQKGADGNILIVDKISRKVHNTGVPFDKTSEGSGSKVVKLKNGNFGLIKKNKDGVDTVTDTGEKFYAASTQGGSKVVKLKNGNLGTIGKDEGGVDTVTDTGEKFYVPDAAAGAGKVIRPGKENYQLFDLEKQTSYDTGVAVPDKAVGQKNRLIKFTGPDNKPSEMLVEDNEDDYNRMISVLQSAGNTISSPTEYTRVDGKDFVNTQDPNLQVKQLAGATPKDKVPTYYKDAAGKVQSGFFSPEKAGQMGNRLTDNEVKIHEAAQTKQAQLQSNAQDYAALTNAVQTQGANTVFMDGGYRMNDDGTVWKDPLTGAPKKLEAMNDAMGKRTNITHGQALLNLRDDAIELSELLSSPVVRADFGNFLNSKVLSKGKATVKKWLASNGLGADTKTYEAIIRMQRLASDERKKYLGVAITPTELGTVLAWLPEASDNLEQMDSKIRIMTTESDEKYRFWLNTWHNEADMSQFYKSAGIKRFPDTAVSNADSINDELNALIVKYGNK